MKKQISTQISRRTAIIVGLVAGGLLFGLIGYFAAVAPQKAQLGTLSSQIDVANTALATASKKVPAPQPIPAHATDLFRLTLAMPNEDNLPSLLVDLTQLAKSNSLSVTALTPSPSVSGAVFTTIPVSMQVSGTYANVKRFVHAMATSVTVDANADKPHVTGRLFIPTSINFSTSSDKGVDATLALNAYVYGSPDAPPPAPAAPAATTTTSG